MPGEELNTPGPLFADCLVMASFINYEELISCSNNLKLGITDINGTKLKDVFKRGENLRATGKSVMNGENIDVKDKSKYSGVFKKNWVMDQTKNFNQCES